uniref:BLTX318 n=1 Tax=Nephila pilipes TaxID=299642 RepID=A0A076KU75_NEPPI|nr:BLTX318 [Nephila pilipes]AII97916.1 BLTX551 [Nephila pilipes]
MGQKGSEH